MARPRPAYRPGYALSAWLWRAGAAAYAYPASAACTGLLTCFIRQRPTPIRLAPAMRIKPPPATLIPARQLPLPARRRSMLRGDARAAPAPAITAQPPYTLDSGDRLRIVVFGQDGLTNSYRGRRQRPHRHAADRLGAGARRDHRPASARIAEKLRHGFIREPHVAVEIEAYRPFFILGEVTAARPISLCRQHDGGDRGGDRRRLRRRAPSANR